MRLFPLVVLLSAMPVIADTRYDVLPVEQRDTSDTYYPQAAGSSATPAQQSPLNARASSKVSQPIVAPDVQWELYSQLNQMREEIQQLRGLVEQQGHVIELIKRQQRERYLDLDHRVNKLGSTLTAQPATLQPHASASPAPIASPGRSDKQIYEDAHKLMKSHQFQEAINLFSSLLVRSPDGEKAPYCEYWLGELLMASSPPDLDNAKLHFITLLTKYPEHPKVPDSMYKLGVVYNRLGEKQKSTAAFKAVVKKYPGKQAAKLANASLKSHK